MDRRSAIKLLIIADDLTGSNDAGAQFAKRGIRSVVLVGSQIDKLPSGYPVVVVNTESRHVPPDEAARRVGSVARLGREAGVLNIFKKTDSTLRGNIGAELKALLETTGERSIVFVPAFPEMGRTTRNGIHYVHGVPLANTEFGIDPLSPVHSSDIAEVLQMNASIPVRTTTDIAEIAGEGCYVLDCESRDQMRAIAHRLEQADRLRLLSGSAAFAEELSHLLPLPRSIPESIILQKPILLVNGSLNPRSFEQISALEEGFEIVRLSADALRNEHPRFELAPNRGGNVLLCSIDNRDSYAAFRDRARQLGISDNELHHRVAAANGRSVKALMADRTFRTLFVIGGDTLIGIAREMKWTAFEPCGEIEAGVTASRPQGQNILVLSKAGGFGDRNVLKRIMANLAH